MDMTTGTLSCNVDQEMKRNYYFDDKVNNKKRENNRNWKQDNVRPKWNQCNQIKRFKRTQCETYTVCCFNKFQDFKNILAHATMQDSTIGVLEINKVISLANSLMLVWFRLAASNIVNQLTTA